MSQREVYTRLQQQQQPQRQQQQQQPQTFGGNNTGQPPFSLSTLDPSLITLQYVKEEYPVSLGTNGLLDPSDPFGLPVGADYDMLGVGLGGGSSSSSATAHQKTHFQQGQTNTMLSPLSTSPLDPVDYDGHLDDSVGSVGSMSTHSQFASSSQGIPLPLGATAGTAASSTNHHFYSMSMPVRTTAGISTHHHKALHNQQQQALTGSQASSYQSYASNSTGAGLSVLRGEHDSLKQ
jgi:hypothetical protein